MNSTLAFLLIIIGALMLQVLTVYLQYRAIKRKYDSVKRRNTYTSVGKSRKRGKQYIALLAFDEKGCLTEGYTLSGITSLARFRKIKGYEDCHYSELPKRFRNSKYENCILEAVGYMDNE